MLLDDPNVGQLARLIRDCQPCIALTGAGISTKTPATGSPPSAYAPAPSARAITAAKVAPKTIACRRDTAGVHIFRGGDSSA
jgi:hypothetical protein